MAHAKKIKQKNQKKSAADNAHPAEEVASELAPIQSKQGARSFDFVEDDIAPVLPIEKLDPAEKLDDAELTDKEGADDESEEGEAGIDAEEIDPFGDKWEE